MPRACGDWVNWLVSRPIRRYAVHQPATRVTSEHLSFSRFHLADLQVHTPADPDHEYGPEWRPDPDPAFAERLVAGFRDAGVTVIAVTDHNRLDWYPVVRAAGSWAVASWRGSGPRPSVPSTPPAGPASSARARWPRWPG